MSAEAGRGGGRRTQGTVERPARTGAQRTEAEGAQRSPEVAARRASRDQLGGMVSCGSCAAIAEAGEARCGEAWAWGWGVEGSPDWAFTRRGVGGVRADRAGAGVGSGLRYRR